MPKIVDYAQRRRDIVDATMRIIARQGLPGATMRDIAAEAGFANGVVKSYFGSKADLLAATYVDVYEATNRRVVIATAGRSGLTALHAFAAEVVPLTPELRDEARVVLSFLAEVAQDPVRAREVRATMARWREWIRGWLAEAAAAGEISAEVSIDVETDILLTYLYGAQTTSILGGESFDFEGFRNQLSYLIARLDTRHVGTRHLATGTRESKETAQAGR
ncbi:TetR/AcrR family transcriptional regulator [Brevibacterium sp. NPDC059310]|uniref:TetR/AcrR family transcriptional regulator n=1 Tax=Brevibacterium sp. NPDC059310 TaxID=3346802 RepID=UPI00366E76F9